MFHVKHFRDNKRREKALRDDSYKASLLAFILTENAPGWFSYTKTAKRPKNP